MATQTTCTLPGTGTEPRSRTRRAATPLAHISPAHIENIDFFGAIEVDLESELAQLGLTRLPADEFRRCEGLSSRLCCRICPGPFDVM